MIPENEMPLETTIVELDLTPEEWAQLMRLAEERRLSLEELVAAAVKKFLAVAAESACGSSESVSFFLKKSQS